MRGDYRKAGVEGNLLATMSLLCVNLGNDHEG